MKIRLTITICLGLLLGTSCQKDDDSYDFEAIVVYSRYYDMITCDPAVYDIKITKGLYRIGSVARNFTEVGDSIFATLNLPEELKEDGLLIKLDLRAPSDDEMPTCYNLEMPLVMSGPIVFVTEVEKIL